MSRRIRNRPTARRTQPALLFAAMGDETRLNLVAKLCNGQPGSISELTRGSRLTRQAVTKHLRALEKAGIVRNYRAGRESFYKFNPESLGEIKQVMDQISRRSHDSRLSWNPDSQLLYA